jgi:hypothetical protein
MPDHHPDAAPDRPTPRQQRYLRQLAQRTGTSFTPPATKAQASREIARLERRTRDTSADRVRDQRAVQDYLQAGVGDSVRHRAGEATGYGSTARWAHGRPETER